MQHPAPADKVAAFLAEARQAIAVHGGLNPAALTRLRAAAQLHGITADQMAAALRSLSGPAATPTSAPAAAGPVPPTAPVGILVSPPKKRRPAAASTASGTPADFPKHVAIELTRARILWPPVYERLIADGTRFDLDEINAVEVIERVGQKLGIPFVSASEAEERILIRAKEMFDRGELSPEANRRLREMAESVGMPGERYDAMVFQVARIPGTGPPAAAFPLRRVAVGLGLFLLVAVAAGVAIVLSAGSPTVVVKEEPADKDKDKGKPTAPPPTKSVAKWGPPELGELLERAAADAPPGLGETWTQQLGSDHPTVRIEGYRVLVKALPGTSPAGLDALAACYAAETHPENADVLLAAVRADLPPTGTPRPTAELIDRWFTAASLAARMLATPGLSTERAAAVARQLDYSLGVKPDPALAPAALVVRAETLAAARIYGLVAELARTAPGEAALLAERCRTQFGRYFAPDVISPLEADVAAAAVGFDGPVSPEGLRLVRGLFDRVAKANTAARVRMATVYAGAKPGPLRDALEEVLLETTGAMKGKTPAETAANIRAKADVVAGANPAAAEHRKQLLALARPALDAAVPPVEKPARLLHDTLTLTHGSTLAVALIGGPQPNDARFAEILAKPPSLGAATPKNPNPPPGLPPEEEAKLVRMLGNNSAADRKAAFQKLADGLDPDTVQPETAAAIARFLTRIPEGDEPATIAAGLSKIGRSPAIQLEFADQILNANNGARPGVEASLAIMLGRPIPLPEGRWKDTARRAILGRLADGGLDEVLTQGASEYRRLLAEQAVLLGANPADIEARAEPSAVLDLLIGVLAGRLARDKLADADRRFLDQIPHLAAALEFQKLNDLQKTVVLQRAWVRVVCLYVGQRQPAAAERAAKLVEELAASDAKTDDALVRLRSGEAAALRAWLLLVESV